MKTDTKNTPPIQVAVIESDPLRFAGFDVLLESCGDIALSSASLSDIHNTHDVNVVLLTVRSGRDLLPSLRTLRPDLPVIITACSVSDRDILALISYGVKGYVDESSSVHDLEHAIRAVNSGSVWLPRRVLSMFVDKASSAEGRRAGMIGFQQLTLREKEVLEMLVEGRSNKEIANPLGIEERTVKAHVAKLMRKFGVQNRIMLSVHAINHSLVSAR